MIDPGDEVFDVVQALIKGALVATTVLLLLALLASCSTVTYRHGDAEFSKTTLGADRRFQELQVEVMPDGGKRMMLKGYESMEGQSLEDVARGAAEGAARGALP